MNMLFLGLPAGLLLSVADFLEENDVNRLTQSNHHFYTLLNPYLCRRNSLDSESSALLWAARRGNEATAQSCILNGANVGAIDRLGRTSLVCAAWMGRGGIVKLLLDTGRVDVNFEARVG
jgi:ankyrin repeat protein